MQCFFLLPLVNRFFNCFIYFWITSQSGILISCKKYQMNLPLKFKLLMFTHTSILLHCPFSEIPPSLEHCPFKSYLCPLRMQCPVHISEHIFGNFVHVQYSIHKQKRSRIVPGKHSTVKIRWSSYSIEEHHVVESNETSN